MCTLIHLTDVIGVGFQRTVYTTSERQGEVELCAVIFDPPTGGAPRDFSLSVFTSDGTAGMAQGSIDSRVRVYIY